MEKIIVAGMQVKIKGYYDKDFLVTNVNESEKYFEIEGDFSKECLPKQTMKVDFDYVFGENLSRSMFSIKEYPKFKQTVLVSNDNDKWYIRSFHGFVDNGDVLTILCGADDFETDSDGHSVGETMQWRYMKLNITI
jgi:hypothetical protein